LAVSDNFLPWTEARTILVPDERDDELARERIAQFNDRVIDDRGPELHNAQFYGMCGFPYEGMYLGMLWVFDVSGFMKGHPTNQVGDGEEGVTLVELTCRRNLQSWKRVADRQPFIPLGAAHTWDAATIYTTNRPLIVGDETWIYYAAHGIGHGHPLWRVDTDRERILREATTHGPVTGIDLARLRLDAWVSIDAGEEGDALTTKPLVFDLRKKLVINAKALEGGSIAVEILDEAGNPEPGYDKDNCYALKGDALRHVVVWRGKSDVSELAGKPVRLRFHVQNAKLYSFVFQD